MVSITFQDPVYLWFLLGLPLLIVAHFYLLRHTKHKALKFANFKVLKRATGNRFITRNYLLLCMRLLIILCAVLAVSQMVVWYDGMTNENEYVITVDTSASMAAEDIPPTRLGAAIATADDFIESLDRNTRVGLVSFSGVTFIEQTLTTDRGDLRNSLDRFEVEASGTDIPGAIITSTNLLVNSERGRTMILITDGSNTIETFQSQSLTRSLQYAQLHRVKIHTVGVGTEGDGPIGYLPQYYNVSATYNTDNLEFIANSSGGNYYQASDSESLQRAYADIKAAEREGRLSLNLAPYLLMIVLVLILVEWLMINTRFRLLP